MTRALDTLARDGLAGKSAGERHMVCLLDRMMEPLVRLQWDELQNNTSTDVSDETLVSSLPFLPKPMERATKARRKKRR